MRLSGLLAVVVLATAVEAADKTPVAAHPAGVPGHPALAPDMMIEEAHLYYPDYKIGFRLVPPGGPSTTSVFRLIENHNVPQGTSLGPQEPSGAPGPIATRTCKTALRAKLQVWVKNVGNAPFNASTIPLGLTGSLDAQAVKEAFGTVAPGAKKYFETGSFTFPMGVHTAVLTVNAAHGGGESNFTNNGLESKFEIVCGQLPPPSPCPDGQVRNPLTGGCHPKPPATATPKAAGKP